MEEEIIDTSGFYKQINSEWFYGPNKVININYELHRELKDTYEYPVDGWDWYDQAPAEYINWELNKNTNILPHNHI